jgi:hypothetical protein
VYRRAEVVGDLAFKKQAKIEQKRELQTESSLKRIKF